MLFGKKPAAPAAKAVKKSTNVTPALFGGKKQEPAAKAAKKAVTQAKKAVAKQAKAVAKKPVPKPVKKVAKAVAKAASPDKTVTLGVVGSLIANVYDSSPLSPTGMRGRENILKVPCHALSAAPSGAAKRDKTSVPDVNIDNYQKYGPVGGIFEAIDLLRQLPSK
eukprot:750624-Pleurochrysis_carterae.AAC.2